MLAQRPHWPLKTGQKTPRKWWQRSILFSGKTSRDPLFRHHRSSQLSGSTKPNRFSASNYFVHTRARFTHKRFVQVPLSRHICTIQLSDSTCLNEPFDQDRKRSAGSPVRSAYLFDSIEWLTHARPFFFVLWLFVVLADGFSSVLWRNAKTKTVSFLYTRSVLPPFKTFQKFHEPADQKQKTFCQKTAAEKCHNFVPSRRTKTLSVKQTLGKRRHTRDRLPSVYWLKKRANKRHVGTRYPLVGTTAGTTSAPQRCHINVYPQVRVHTCQKHGDRGQEHKSRVWHSKKLSFSLLSVSRADHDFTAPLTGPLLRCNNAPSWLALNVSFKVLSYFCQIKRHAFYPTKRWRFSS